MASTPDFDAIAASSRHGTRSRYKHGCRCDDCRAANTAYQRQRRHALRLEEAAEPGSNRDGWIAPVVGISVALAAAWALIRRAATS